MTYTYVARFREVFACNDVSRGLFVFVLVVAQLGQTSDPPRLFKSPRLIYPEEFSNPLPYYDALLIRDLRLDSMGAKNVEIYRI